MAGDWIKMRSNLWDDPRIAKLCDVTDQPEAMIVGALYWLWATADQHSEDGLLHGLTLRSIDRKTGIKGFGDALLITGWLADHPDGVQIVRFDEHNGTSAKKRCQTAKRVANFKTGNANETPDDSCGNADCVTKALPVRDLEKEKRREEVNLELGGEISESPSPEVASPSATPLAKKSISSSRLPTDWVLPKAWGEWAMTENPGWTPDDVRKEAEKFRDHWLAKAGADARKADWLATWRMWVRRSSDFSAKSGQAPATVSNLFRGAV